MYRIPHSPDSAWSLPKISLTTKKIRLYFSNFCSSS